MHEVALDADDVGAEEQRAGDGEAEDAVDADDREPVLALQGQRLAEAPGVDEEAGPADGERHQAEPQDPSSTVLVPAQKTSPCQKSDVTTASTPTTASDEPDPQRDAADPAVAGDELGGPGQEQGHHHQRHGAAEPDALRRGRRW